VLRLRSPVGANPTRQLLASAASNRSGGGGNEAIVNTPQTFAAVPFPPPPPARPSAAIRVSGVEGRLGRLGEHACRNASERRAGLKAFSVGADPPRLRGRPQPLGSRGSPPRLALDQCATRQLSFFGRGQGGC